MLYDASTAIARRQHPRLIPWVRRPFSDINRIWHLSYAPTSNSSTATLVYKYEHGLSRNNVFIPVEKIVQPLPFQSLSLAHSVPTIAIPLQFHTSVPSAITMGRVRRMRPTKEKNPHLDAAYYERSPYADEELKPSLFRISPASEKSVNRMGRS